MQCLEWQFQRNYHTLEHDFAKIDGVALSNILEYW